METDKTQPIHLAGSVFHKPRHVCAFFPTHDEQTSILMPFIKEGFSHGDKAYHIVDPRHREDRRRDLRAAAIDVATAERNSQMEIRVWEETYLKDGYFDQHRQLALIENVLTAGKAQGYPLTRLVANMEWALEPRPGVGDLVEYETRLNLVLPKYDDAIV